jgi:hypothetical protein
VLTTQPQHLVEFMIILYILMFEVKIVVLFVNRRQDLCQEFNALCLNPSLGTKNLKMFHNLGECQ